MELTEQPTPSEANCPYCGGDPEYDPEHQLSFMGYTHDDVTFDCSECDERWVSGIPIGEYDGPLAEDLYCRQCEKRYGLVHRVRPLTGHYERDLNDEDVSDPTMGVEVHMKCPNEDCRYFWTFERDVGPHGTVMMGYPQITGDVDGAEEAYGYAE